MDNPLLNGPWPWPTSLSLVSVRGPLLGEILSTTKALKCFRWEWCYLADSTCSDDPVYSSKTVDPDRFMRALENTRDTLTELSIACQ